MATKPVEGTAAESASGKDKETLIAVLQFLKKKNLTETEKIFKQEANCLDAIKEFNFETTPDGETADLSSVLSAYNSDADPSRYEEFYASLQGFVQKSLDIHKPELAMVLYPLFIHMYLELVFKGHEKEARSFFGKFRECQEDYHDEDLIKLAAITRKEHMASNDFMSTLRSNKFVIKMSRDTYHTLKKHLQDNQQEVLLTLIQQHLHFDVFEGRPRTKKAIESTTGAITGEATFEANKSKIHYGRLAEPDLGVVIEEETEEEEDKDKPKKKKPKKDSNGPGKKKQEHNPNAPPRNRIPFPEMKDSEKLMKVTMMRESAKRLKLDSETLPSVCLYSVLNSHQSLNTVSISEDSSLMAAGFDNSAVRVWSLTPQKLRSLKSSSELLKIDKESEDVMERVMDDRSSTDCRRLIGHSGPVFSTSFSQDNQFLLSSSEDKTVRLWSLFTFSTLVSYRGHNYPVWDVTFCPRGYYFASASHDRTARLWSTDHHQPLRIFAGHMSDVNRVAFHPNCNYVATGSCDRTVRLWDIKTGTCTRLFTGHKGSVYSLVFSMDGRYLISSGADARILFWDLAEGTLAAEVKGHSGTVHSLVFSRDGNILASGGTDNCVKLWDAQAIYNSGEDVQRAGQPKGQDFGLGSYPTKNTPLHCLHFTLRNLLLASGPFSPS